MSATEDLARRIESQAAIAAVPGQLDALEQIALEVRELDEKLHADSLVRQTELKGMSVEDGATLLELGSPRELVIAWVDAARKMLGDAPNYSETRIDFPRAAVSMETKAAGEYERYVFTVQRAGKVTPHEARQAAEAERDAAREELQQLRRWLRAVSLGRATTETHAEIRAYLQETS